MDRTLPQQLIDVMQPQKFNQYLWREPGTPEKVLDIDFADMWPRMYFRLLFAMLEAQDWLKVRGQFVEDEL